MAPAPGGHIPAVSSRSPTAVAPAWDPREGQDNPLETKEVRRVMSATGVTRSRRSEGLGAHRPELRLRPLVQGCSFLASSRADNAAVDRRTWSGPTGFVPLAHGGEGTVRSP